MSVSEVLSSSAIIIVAIIESTRSILQWRLKRKAQKEDRAEACAEKSDQNEHKTLRDEINRANSEIIEVRADVGELRTSIDNLLTAQRISIADRLVYICRSHIRCGKISFSDRSSVLAMYDLYENKLGNGVSGDLPELIAQIRSLGTKD